MMIVLWWMLTKLFLIFLSVVLICNNHDITEDLFIIICPNFYPVRYLLYSPLDGHLMPPSFGVQFRKLAPGPLFFFFPFFFFIFRLFPQASLNRRSIILITNPDGHSMVTIGLYSNRKLGIHASHIGVQYQG